MRPCFGRPACPPPAQISNGLSETDDLGALVRTSLWGNVADLSLSAGAALTTAIGQAEGAGASRMLTDDSAGVCEALRATAEGELVLVLDNCGLELLADLLLVDGLLRLVQPARVSLHVKDAPVFVSDVCPHDLPPTLDWLDAHGGGAVAGRLRASFSSGRLRLVPHPFYTSAHPFWSMPHDLREAYAAAGAVLLKGDANYRRMLGDLHWPHYIPFAPLMRRYWPQGTAVAALRTCKSGVLVGVAPEVEAAAVAAEPDRWLTGGVFGLVSLAPGTEVVG